MKERLASRGGMFFNTASNVFSVTTTLFSIIVMYFIYLFSGERLGTGNQWGLLHFASKWYLIVVVGIFAVFVAIALIISVISFIFWFSFFFRK